MNSYRIEMVRVELSSPLYPSVTCRRMSLIDDMGMPSHIGTPLFHLL